MTHSPIQIETLSKTFGVVPALNSVSLTVEAGEMFGLIGHNGAGKSTLFKLMLGLLQASAGSVRVHGVDTASGDFRQVRRRIGYLPESFVTYDNLSGMEVLQLFADLKKVPRATCAGVLERVGLGAAAARRVHTYSKGMRQRLGFAQALLGDPDLIFLDEPTNGLDPEGIADFYAILRDARARGATIVVTSHILAEIQDRVDRLLILHSGQIAAQGTLSQLRGRVALPSTIVATVHAAQHAAARGALGAIGELELHSEGDQLTISCRGAQKMAVLSLLSPLATDIVIHEPTLEDVFLGQGGRNDRAH
jgi:Cu-processing system ATP-binding protein